MTLGEPDFLLISDECSAILVFNCLFVWQYMMHHNYGLIRPYRQHHDWSIDDSQPQNKFHLVCKLIGAIFHLVIVIYLKYLNIEVFKLQLTRDVHVYPKKGPHLCSIAPCKIYSFTTYVNYNTTYVAL